MFERVSFGSELHVDVDVLNQAQECARAKLSPILDFHTHVGLSAHAHNIMQEVEVHGWLLRNRPFHIKQWNVGPSYDILHTQTVITV